MPGLLLGLPQSVQHSGELRGQQERSHQWCRQMGISCNREHGPTCNDLPYRYNDFQSHREDGRWRTWRSHQTFSAEKSTVHLRKL